jgi:hypothetical protein
MTDLGENSRQLISGGTWIPRSINMINIYRQSNSKISQIVWDWCTILHPIAAVRLLHVATDFILWQKSECVGVSFEKHNDKMGYDQWTKYRIHQQHFKLFSAQPMDGTCNWNELCNDPNSQLEECRWWAHRISPRFWCVLPWVCFEAAVIYLAVGRPIEH